MSRSPSLLVLKPSPIHGVGVFTTSAIRRKDVVVLFPVRDWIIVPKLRNDYIGRHFCHKARRGWYTPRNPHRMVVGWYLNHSESPNVALGAKSDRALRYIRSGDELTINYDTLDIWATLKRAPSPPKNAKRVSQGGR